ncbi:MAG: hypothetical protein AABX03_02645 [Nanoarchaeota archaeon]
MPKHKISFNGVYSKEIDYSNEGNLALAYHYKNHTRDRIYCPNYRSRLIITIAEACEDIRLCYDNHNGSLRSLKVRGVGPSTKKDLEDILNKLKMGEGREMDPEAA